MFIKKKLLYNKSGKILKKKNIIKKNLKSFLNDKYVAQLFKKDRVNYKFFNKESIDIFFKLLFLIQKKKIKLIKRILKLFFNMRLELRLYLFKRISKIFKIYFKNFLEKFLKEKKVINSNIILFRIRSSFYHLQFNKKKNTGLLFLQFPKKRKRNKQY
jgi:hypothetical protein